MPLFHRNKSPAEGSSKPSRRRDQLLGLFSRSGSPSSSSTAPQAKSTNGPAVPQVSSVSGSSQQSPRPTSSPVIQRNETPDIPTELGQDDGPVGSKDTQDVTSAETPVSKDGSLDPAESTYQSSAYRAALSTFSADERHKLAQRDTIRSLFQQLNELDEAHLEQSQFRKGVKAVTPHLERVNATIDFISPFVSIEPTAGTAIGLVKASISIAAAVFGHFNDITQDITSFLDRIPAIDRCAEVVKADGRMPAIHDALVNVYKVLLEFYLAIVTLFEDRRFVLRAASQLLNNEVKGIVSSFKNHVDLLSSLLEAEGFASTQEIKDELLETKIRETLERNANGLSYRNDLKRRADDACSWIISDDSFSVWVNSRESSLLALFGNMGFGKTMTTAFVADTLEQRHLTVCDYYCKDEQETTKLGNIYRNILAQILRQKPSLKRRFGDWYDNESTRGTDPTHFDDKLRKLLYELISSFSTPLFIVLDALDECEAGPRKELLSLFGELMRDNARLKVFVSSRYNDAVEDDLPSKFTTRIELHPTQDRDRAIAAYLIANTNVPVAFHSRVVEELASRADGSAIWLKIAIAYVAASRIKSSEGLRIALNRLSSSKGLTELYGNLFSKTCEISDNEALLGSALEILAVARRPLTEEELAYAVFTPVDEDAVTLSDLGKLASSIDLLSLVRPFVTATEGEGGKSTRLRLLHQSLKDLLLTAPPSEWCSAKEVATRKKGARTAELEANLLQRCIENLLFEECGESSLYPDPESEVVSPGRPELSPELLAGFDIFGEDEETSDSRSPSVVDPSQLGFGSFFAYAAVYWTSHLSEVSPERRPDARKLIDLCRKGSVRLENWVEQWRRPSGYYIPERDLPFRSFEYVEVSSGTFLGVTLAHSVDPLVVTALFGPVESVTDLLSIDASISPVTQNSAWTYAGILLRRHYYSALKLLIRHTALKSTLCSAKFFYAVLDRLNDGEESHTIRPELEEFIEYLISELREDLLDFGNGLFCRTAELGCLIMIRMLWSAAEKDAELRQALLTPTAGHRGRKESYYHHQSIGLAACNGHADVVRFLCQQPELEPHLRYINGAGLTVFHQAMRLLNEEVLVTLTRHWPEGVNIRDKDGSTPLCRFIDDRHRSDEDRVITFTRIFLHQGKADATGRDDIPGESPLCIAVRRGHVALMRILVVEGGADVAQVVTIDEATGRPALVKDIQTYDDDAEGLRDRMLKELCSLLPLAVSVEHLS
ncbi:uncharacterized protein B0T15DRAFT_490017 [Chaetomium strumarium]|uniref:Nephrocystin 3-like N-terminal domain-containing protein n=1 Tax=Chaetomium strumarium TaxID=1170767 RepID=A0AAJ0M701_9PEZI|nr:hypothetical protein B0T15DRAFT_490017 [Chaetomium strumarium]